MLTGGLTRCLPDPTAIHARTRPEQHPPFNNVQPSMFSRVQDPRPVPAICPTVVTHLQVAIPNQGERTVRNGHRNLRAVIALMSLIGSMLAVQAALPGVANARCNGVG